MADGLAAMNSPRALAIQPQRTAKRLRVGVNRPRGQTSQPFRAAPSPWVVGSDQANSSSRGRACMSPVRGTADATGSGVSGGSSSGGDGKSSCLQ